MRYLGYLILIAFVLLAVAVILLNVLDALGVIEMTTKAKSATLEVAAIIIAMFASGRKRKVD